MDNQQDIKNFISKLKRKPESHKYDYGHVLVIAGSKNMPGAGVLCCNAAMRSGAGLVTYAVKENFFANACSMSRPETMFFVYESASNIIEFIKKRKVSAVIIGPGLAVESSLRRFIEKIIFSVDIPVILDASGLAVFNEKLKNLKNAKAKLILTPHMGEFANLINKSADEIEKNRNHILDRFTEDNSFICVLKGHNTIVSDGNDVYVNNTGTPAMAKAGSGDVLSGVIAAFSCVNENLFEAAKYAVYFHGLAGEMAEKEKGSGGVTASDIAENICYAVKEITSQPGE
ncbi:MAG: NAD(P)H-hydrate dehydratase [Endomicrobia bacterium]|nr:NAD(P)H-hydrate dehydratase [Endomicrobiia bacterium]